MASPDARQSLQDGVARRPVAFQNLSRGVVPQTRDGQEQMFGRNVFVLESFRLLEGTLEERTRYAVREEMATTLADLLCRRLDLATAGHPTPVEVETVLEVLARERGWGEGRRAEGRAAFEREMAPVGPGGIPSRSA